MFQSLQLRVKTKDPIQLSPEFKKDFTYKIIKNTDDGGEFVFQSQAHPIEFYNKAELLEEFNTNLKKFVNDFEISEINDLVCFEPYIEMTFKLYTMPNELAVLPSYQKKTIQKAIRILNKLFNFVYLEGALVIQTDGPKQDKKPNA